MSLSDENTSMVDGFCKSELEHNSLQSSLEEIVSLESENVIELLLGLIEQAIASHSSQHSRALEIAPCVVLRESQQGTGSLSQLGHGVLDAPDLLLRLEAVLSAQSQFTIQTLLLKRTSGGFVDLSVIPVVETHTVIGHMSF